MDDISVGIKTFIRVAELDAALDSLSGMGFHEVIVADDSEMDDTRRALYRKHRNTLPLKLLELPYNTGVSYGRNRIVDACDTPLLLLMDDDMALTQDVSVLRDIVRSDPCIGGVSAMWEENGIVFCEAGNLHIFDKCLVQDVGFRRGGDKTLMGDGISHYRYDMISNFTLFNMAVFDDVRWDEAYRIMREHIDFYVAHKQLGRWRFVTTPNYVVCHRPNSVGSQSATYKTFRHAGETFRQSDAHFRQKWDKPSGIVWGLPHQPMRFSLAQHVHHMQLGLNPIFRFFK